MVRWINNAKRLRIKLIDFITRDYNGKFKYKDLVPKIKLPEFLLSVQNLLNLCFFFRNDGKVDIIDRETIITGACNRLIRLHDW